MFNFKNHVRNVKCILQVQEIRCQKEYFMYFDELL